MFDVIMYGKAPMSLGLRVLLRISMSMFACQAMLGNACAQTCMLAHTHIEPMTSSSSWVKNHKS